MYIYVDVSRGSGVGTATAHGLDDREIEVRVPMGFKNLNFSIPSRPILGPTKPPIQCVQGALYQGVKLPGREAQHSPPTSVEVTKTPTVSWRSS
jgi:hypothetical protein